MNDLEIVCQKQLKLLHIDLKVKSFVQLSMFYLHLQSVQSAACQVSFRYSSNCTHISSEESS